ncbi:MULTISPECIES: HD domain-containing protein [Pseudomonas]|uniref:HD domain-containing protein n=1 Tax=Pseudomonas TaxID=286 RepID=UPI000382D941|nr:MULTISPECIES: hypothetical protein [Pseudomonas]AYN98109.1 phosphohydrolase [Pseudomonas sp. LTGT-11-2Z]MDH0572771.1 phosphohydrolase [Pseudomonas fulva]PIK78831.1 phosphohydrolase [Pseudomonas sp. 382]
MKKVSFKRIDQMTPSEWKLIESFETEEHRSMPSLVIDSLKMLAHGEQPYQIDRLQHSLQSATRAFRDGADEEMVVAALVHDIGDSLALYNHAEMAGALIKPYVSEKTHWIVLNHDVFQGFYYWENLGWNKDAREKFRGHPWFDECDKFCRDWDCLSFDPEYDTLSLDFFAPMIERVFSRKPYSHR